jgi:tetratricopeptide (TPR) repeat protein
MESCDAYAQAVEYDVTNLAAMRGYVETAQKLGRLADAQALYKAVVARSPGDAFAHEGLGMVLFAAGGQLAATAQAELAKAVELAPDIADFQFRLGLLNVESDRYSEALAPLSKAVQLDGQRARYRLPYAVALARTGDRAKAVQQLQTVLTLRPTREDVALAEKAARNLIDPFRGFPQPAREQFEIALNWLDHDSPAQATQVLESLLQKYPDLAIVHTLLGLAAAKSDDASRAIYSLRHAIELDPDLAEPRLYLGDIYFSRGRADNAREHYEAAVARNPFLPDAYRRLAEVHLKANEGEQAAEEYRVYLLLRPDDIDATLARAKTLTDINSPDAGLAWDQAAEDFPRRPEVLVGRGKYYFTRAALAKTPEDRNKAKTEAGKNLETVIEMDPENATATNILAQLRQL